MAPRPQNRAESISAAVAAAPLRHRAGAADELVRRELFDAIIDHRVPPGTPLPEDTLAGVFGVSRTVVRKALLRLGHEKLVELRPNRGAIVARPSVEEAHQIFEARRVVEAAIVDAAVVRAADGRLAALRGGLAAEAAAERAGDRRALIRLSGDFHRALAATAGNDPLAEFLGELISRTSLILALYQTFAAPFCAHDEHAAVLEAVMRRDAAEARRRMTEHLTHIERSLDLFGAGATVDLPTIFAHVAAQAGARTG